MHEIIFVEEELSVRSLQIHEDALKRAKKYLVAEAELLDAIIEVDRGEIYKKLGFTHLTPYCVQKLGLSTDVAGCFVRVARKSIQVPELKFAVDAGLPVTKAKTIAAVINSANQKNWIEKAQTLSKEKLEREIVRENPLVKKSEKAKPVGVDRHRVEFEINEEEMSALRRAQDLVSQKMGRSASLAETQKFLLEAFLNANDPVRKADRSRDRSQAKLTAKSKQAVMHAKKNKPLESSTLKNSIPAASKHKVNQRDRGLCQARQPNGEKCASSRWVQIHHIVPQAEGGIHEPENLITLCASHHRLWHDREENLT